MAFSLIKPYCLVPFPGRSLTCRMRRRKDLRKDCLKLNVEEVTHVLLELSLTDTPLMPDTMALTSLLITADMKANGRNQMAYERMSDF